MPPPKFLDSILSGLIFFGSVAPFGKTIRGNIWFDQHETRRLAKPAEIRWPNKGQVQDSMD
ncbi:hypothetical protein AUQ43_03545 [Thalassospira sp. MCCC 1A01148]|uniref:Uncharacterized protein n=1 Tax=Thalassospira profundimaris TaxID=502049 RepID=A0A367V8Q7_9PROT|nr:hypothetical protein AUQ43_03545 [Thalassospira sp. MCCC 1A01148]RCK21409.1 hypothetical protein TH6_12380 [Thalassospira profundimaris]